MAGASFTTSIPLDLYASLMAEVKSTGESRNAVVVRALRSALDGERPVDREFKPGPAVVGKSETPARVDDGPPATPAQTQVLAEESVASPCCGADIQVNEGRRFCSDCGTLVPS